MITYRANMTSMIRTQVQLDEIQFALLKREAAERGISMAALMRLAVDSWLIRRQEVADRERAIVAVKRGGFRSGKRDIAEEHDRYLAEDFMA